MIGMLRRREMMAQSRFSLPSEYQQVEYLQNNGNAIIDTNMKFTNYLKPEYKIQIISGVPSVGYAFFTGARDAISKRVEGILSSDSFGVVYGNVSTGLAMFPFSKVYDINTIKIDDEHIYFNDEVVANISNNSFSMNRTAYLFYYNSPTYAFVPTVKYFYYKVSQNGNTIMHLIPCYRKSDNEPGMYDIVNDVFYTNAGTGEFLVGPNV